MTKIRKWEFKTTENYKSEDHQVTNTGKRTTWETFSIRFFIENRKPQFTVTLCSFTLPRFQILARRSVEFSSLLFRQNIIQYKNTYRNCKVAREPRRNQNAYEAWAPQCQRNKYNKMKSVERYVKNRKETDRVKLWIQ